MCVVRTVIRALNAPRGGPSDAPNSYHSALQRYRIGLGAKIFLGHPLIILMAPPGQGEGGGPPPGGAVGIKYRENERRGAVKLLRSDLSRFKQIGICQPRCYGQPWP